MESAIERPTIWTTGYMPNGMKVSFTVPIMNLNNAFAEALAFTDKLLADGLLLSPKGLEDGEIAEQVGYVLRRVKDDGTPVIDLYPVNEKTTFRFVMTYLDTPEDIKDFEHASGLQLNAIPLYEGDRLERDGKEKSKKYIVRLTTPCTAIIKNNPHYNPDEPDVKKRKPKRLFVRWDGVNANASISNEKGSNSSAEGETALTDADEWDKTAVEQFVKHYHGQMAAPQLLIALGGISKWSDWKQGKRAAYIAVDGALALAKVDF